MKALLMVIFLLRCLFLPQVCAGSHSLSFFYTVVSDRSPTFPDYVVSVTLDEVPVMGYNSWTQTLESKVDWISQANDDFKWEGYSQRLQIQQRLFKENLKVATARMNQTRGPVSGYHYLQGIVSCELKDDGTTAGSADYAFDGQDFLSFEKDRVEYVARMPAAEENKKNLNADRILAQKHRSFLEQECIEMWKKYATPGIKSLDRIDQPKVNLSHRKSGKSAVLICHAYGFYPRQILIKWVKEGVEVEVREAKKILPNPDGSFQIKVSVDVTGEHAELYACHVAHISLSTELVVWFEEEKNRTWIGLPVVLVIIIVAAGIAGIFFRRRNL